MKRAMSMLFVLLLAVSGVFASGQTDSTEDGTTAIKSTVPVGVENEYGYLVPEETLEFDVYAGVYSESTFPDAEGIFDDFLLEKFNTKINMMYFDVPYTEKMNLMLAVGDYPDVMAYMTPADAQNFVRSRRALDVTDLVQDYAPNIVAELGKYINLIKDDDGKLFKLPRGFGFKADKVGNAFSIRADLHNELELPVPKTPDEFYEQLKAILAANPTNEVGEKMYGLSDNTEGNLIRLALLGAWGFDGEYAVQDDGSLKYWMSDPRAEELSLYINKMYREGMFDPDFAGQNWDEWIIKTRGERVAANVGVWWHTFVGRPQEPPKNIEMQYKNFSVTAPGVDQHTLAGVNFFSSGYYALTDNCEDPEGVMRWLNWESSMYGIFITAYGAPGPNNFYDFVDGELVLDERTFGIGSLWTVADTKASQGSQVKTIGAKRAAFIDGPLEMPYELDPRMRDTTTIWDWYAKDFDGNFADPSFAVGWGDYDVKVFDETLFKLFNFLPNDPEAIIKVNIDDLVKTEWIKIITAESAAACLETLAEAREKLIKYGVEDLEAFLSKQYMANSKKLNN
jgi:putative aldouronate transport system substrate-binding protein